MTIGLQMQAVCEYGGGSALSGSVDFQVAIGEPAQKKNDPAPTANKTLGDGKLVALVRGNCGWHGWNAIANMGYVIVVRNHNIRVAFPRQRNNWKRWLCKLHSNVVTWEVSAVAVISGRCCRWDP